jgi:acyl-CoA thioester hydrolase
VTSGFRFATDITVRFSETDAQGVVHNAVYLVWFEIARIDYLARFRGGYPALRAQGIEALTLEAHVRYREPARFDDRLRIHARCLDVRGARFRFEYQIVRVHEQSNHNGKDSTLPDVIMADGWTGHAVVDGTTFRPTRMPAWLADAIVSAES